MTVPTIAVSSFVLNAKSAISGQSFTGSTVTCTVKLLVATPSPATITKLSTP